MKNTPEVKTVQETLNSISNERDFMINRFMAVLFTHVTNLHLFLPVEIYINMIEINKGNK